MSSDPRRGTRRPIPRSLPAVACILLLLAAPAWGEITFAPPASFPVGGPALLPAVADLNRDGNPDLAVPESSGKTVAVLLGDGAGSFAVSHLASSSATPYAAVSLDMNRDGRVDLAVALNDGIRLIEGDGAGGFTWDGKLSTTATPNRLVTGDFNRDGKMDLAAVTGYANKATVLLGNGAGGFNASDHPVGQQPVALAAADFDRDGNLDLATADLADSTVTILWGDGEGGFPSTSVLQAGTSPQNLLAGDLNRDGKPDLAVAAYGDSAVEFLLGDGARNFTRRQPLGVSGRPISLVLADLDRDGRVELVTGESEGARLHLIRPDNTNTFHLIGSVDLVSIPSFLKAADFDRDGRPDLAVCSWSGQDVSLLRNTTPLVPGGRFESQDTSTVGTSPVETVTADFNRDGRPDVAVTNMDSGTISVLLGTGTAPPLGPPTAYHSGPHPHSLATADFDRDGALDLVAGNHSDGTFSLLLGGGDGTFGTPWETGVGGNPVGMAVADVDRDGIPDLAVASLGLDKVFIFHNDGRGNFTQGASYDFGFPEDLLAADFDRDGIPDLAVACQVSDQVHILLGNGDGTFEAAAHLSAGTDPLNMAAGDLDGDGVPDLVVANYGSADFTVLLGNGDGTFRTLPGTGVGANPTSPTLSDFDLDGVPDLALASRDNNRVYALLGRGDGTFRGPWAYWAGDGCRGMSAGDLTGDGRPDLVTANGDEGMVAVLSNTPPHIDSATLSRPATVTVPAGSPTPSIHCSVTLITLTDLAGPRPGLQAQLGYGPPGSDPTQPGTGWNWTDLSWEGDDAGRDDYQGTLTVAGEGTYAYTCRFNYQAHFWYVTDLDGFPYQPDQAGTLTVTSPNQSPVLTVGDGRTVVEGQTLSIALSATDPEHGTLTFSAADLPEGAAFTDHGDGTATFAWTPRYDQQGTYPDITFTVTDDGAPPALDSENVTLTVADPAGAIFRDGFGSGAGRWTVRGGTWSVTRTKSFQSGSLRALNLATVTALDPVANPLLAGRLTARVKWGVATSAVANGGLVFALQDKARYRYLKVQGDRVIIGQEGEMGGEPAGVKKSVKRRFAARVWHPLRLDLLADGTVRAYRGKVLLATATFTEAVPGGVGLAAWKSRTLFDDLTLWDEAVLK
jgi:hypothetical protein